MPYPEVATHSLRTLDARQPHARNAQGRANRGEKDT